MGASDGGTGGSPAPSSIFLFGFGGVRLARLSLPPVVAKPMAGGVIAASRVRVGVEDTELRDVQASGLSGEGVRVCMVDTGMEADHDAFSGLDVEFKDFVGISVNPRITGPLRTVR